jgi:hypothetical protein
VVKNRGKSRTIEKMAGRFQPPEKFSFKPSDWEEWIEDFQRFRIASKLFKDAGAVQRDSLIYSMGSREAVKILKTLKFDEEKGEDDTKYDVLVAKFTEYFIPKRNLILFHQESYGA